MTEALQKMIAAMNAELERQSPVEILTLIETDGRHEPTIIIDMERLARAGLLAIQNPTEDMVAFMYREMAYDTPEESFENGILAILSEQSNATPESST